MADSVQRRGRDTFVISDKPDASRAQAPYPKMANATSRIYVYLPLPGVRNRTIESATLSVPVRGSWEAQVLTATPVAADWGGRTTTWNKQPAVRSNPATNAVTAKTDGQRVEIDVTSHVQAVADGVAHYGWRVTTNSSANNRVYGFDAPGNDSWVLTVDYIEAPEPPSDLSPNGGVVSTEPMLTFDFVDAGGASAEQASLQVRVNTAASTSGAWTSDEIATSVPEFNLATSAWPTSPTYGTRYYWQVRVKDGAGYWSEWSDWANFVYAPKPTLSVTNPSAGVAWDVTPTIAASISSGTIQSWRIRIARGNDKTKILYDSGRQPGDGTSQIAHTIPFRDEDRRRILRDDKDYWLNVRVWDRLDRESTSGDPTWFQSWTQFHLDDDLTPPPPESLQVVQIGDSPEVRLTWERSGGYAEGWIIRRGGQNIERLDPDEVEQTGDVFTWVDTTAAPWVQHTWDVKVIDGGKKSGPSPTATLTPEVKGVWLLFNGFGVSLDGVDIDGFKTRDKRATFSPINAPRDVDIVSALGGITGTFSGSTTDPNARSTLLEWRTSPHLVIQLVYGTVSVPVQLSNISVLPSPEFTPSHPRHDVSFDVTQVGEFNEVGG